jgi:hypothetical protein
LTVKVKTDEVSQSNSNKFDIIVAFPVGEGGCTKYRRMRLKLGFKNFSGRTQTNKTNPPTLWPSPRGEGVNAHRH